MINSTAYYSDFWNEMRGKQAVTDSLYNNRESKTNAYHLPGESNKKYTAVLQKESAVRQLATVVNATRSDSRLWTFDCEGQAEWGDILYEYGKEGNIRRNPEISHGTYGYQCDFKCLHALKVRGCGERNKTPGKRRKRVEKVCTIKG